MCTGYKNTALPAVLSQDMRSKVQGDASLYLHCFHPDLSDIAFLGSGPTLWWNLDLMCQLMAAVFAGTRTLPAPDTMREWIATRARLAAQRQQPFALRRPRCIAQESIIATGWSVAAILGTGPSFLATVWNAMAAFLPSTLYATLHQVPPCP